VAFDMNAAHFNKFAAHLDQNAWRFNKNAAL
jgi:hypothetical protein